MQFLPTAIAVLLCSAIFSGPATAQTNSPPNEDTETNIVGGQQSLPGAWPAYAAGNFPSASCGGSLIDNKWVLTAAHCDGAFDDGVRIGVETLSDGDDGEERQVIRSIPHPNYNDFTLKNDIMLLELADPPVTGVPLFQYEKSSSISVPTDGSELTVMGFGTTSSGGSVSDKLRQVNVKTVSYNKCIDQYTASDICESVMFCAGVEGGGKDSCQGDSGGPIVRASDKVQVGIVSWGYGCASALYSGVYTRVGSFSEWIDCIVGGGSNCPLGGEGSCGASGGGGGGGGITKNRSRRRLQSTASKSMNPGDETYQAYLKDCGHFEYPLFLHVDKYSHLLVYGVPPEAALEAGCPFGAGHVVFDRHQGKPVTKKEILIWSDVGEGLSVFKEKESLPIGTFKLADLAKAYEATPDVGGENKGLYDIITNNCATYGIKLASTLGIQIDGRITSFVARRLLEESGKDLADKIRNSLHYFSLFKGSRNLRSHHTAETANENLSDREVVEALVSKSASRRINL